MKNKSLFNNNKINRENNESKSNENNSNKKSQFNNKKIDKNKNKNKELMDAYKGNYKFYVMNNLHNTQTIISEEPGKEESL